MNLLYISYWGIEEGLTQATVIPHLKILSQFKEVNSICLVTLERGYVTQTRQLTEKITHQPILSKSKKFKALGQILDFLYIPKILKKYCTELHIEKIIARGALAGTLAYKTAEKLHIPYYVESFEPHADYMKETGVWKKGGVKYKMQRKWEIRQINTASGLITVTQGYADYLKSHSPGKTAIRVAPCAVNTEDFGFDEKLRALTRENLGISEKSTVGIYVGKFGDLYMDLDELTMLRTINEIFPDLVLIILTPMNHEKVKKAIKSFLNPGTPLIVKSVPHNEVPEYLSAADFALSFVRSFPTAIYNSPVKHGEYWANGLPILMTEGIGDESEFLEKEKGGVIINKENSYASIEKLKEILKDPDHRRKIPEIAKKYRSFDNVRKAYIELVLEQ